MIWMSARRHAVGASLLVFVVAAMAGAVHPAPAAAQQGELTLSTNLALWSDVIEAHVTAVGCTGPARLGFVDEAIDVDLAGCSAGSTAHFSGTVEIGPLHPDVYTVRLRNAAQANPPLDTATLSVHPLANLAVEVPDVVTDAAPFTLVFEGLAFSSCFGFDPPVVEGNVLRAHFSDDCAILPPGGPQVFHEEVEVGPLPAGEYEVRFFDSTFTGRYPTEALHRRRFVIHDADRCVPSDTALCLNDGRFEVEATWKDFFGNEGVGHAIPLAEAGSASGLLWFFAPDNVELTVKVLNACGPADEGAWWVFISSGTTVAYTVTVTDTATGTHREYSNQRGVQAPLVADTNAFPCFAPGSG